MLPRIYRTQDEQPLREMLGAAKAAGVSAVTVGNLGHLALVRDMDLELRGDFSLNVFNSVSLAFLKEQGLDTATVSFELRNEQIRDLQKCLPCEAIVYGRLPLMITENCIVENALGHRCGEMPRLTDRRGAQFPVMKAYGCRSEIQNARTLYLADRDEYRHIGLCYARLRFTTESAQECVDVLRAYLGQGDYRPADFTRGLFYRGVE